MQVGEVEVVNGGLVGVRPSQSMAPLSRVTPGLSAMEVLLTNGQSTSPVSL